MPQFAAFFADGVCFGIEVVQSLDAAQPQDIARAQHPTGQLSAVPAVLLDGQGRHKLLLGAAVLAECHRGWQEDREAPG